MSGPLSFIDGSSCSTCSAAAGSSRATACAYPELQAVVRDAPRSFSPAAARSPFTAFPCQLAPLHLASALGRDGCVRALLEAGASPFVWTRPPPPAAPAGGGGAEGGAAAAAAGADAGDDDDHFSSYEGVCSSGVYQSLKQLLPSSSEFPYTFTLAQQLLRTPCSPLLLAVRFGRLAAAQALLEAMEGGRAAADAAAAAAAAGGGVEERGGADGSASGGGDGDAAPDLVLTPSFATASAAASQASAGSGLGAAPCASSSSSPSSSSTSQAAALASHLDAALAYWPVASEPHVELLRRLLGAGGSGCARPLRRLLPAILARYDNCNPQSGMADKLREGLREVLAHVLPPGEEGGGSGGGGCAWRDGMPPPAPPALRQLLTAAVVCRDEARCGVLLAALDASCPAPWADVAANCALLAAAAAHDMAGVVEGLLARPPPPPGDGMPPFNANMWGPDGLSVLMTAAHRGSLAALQALLAAGAAVNLADEMGCTALGWGVVGNSQEAVVMLAQHGAAIDHFGVVHEEEEHLERALLTATARSNLPMIRLLVGLGASLDAPSPGGSTPLSVAVCWEQQEAAKLLLQLGADPNQVLPAHVNSGCYPMWSDSYSAEEAHTLLGMACSRIEFRDHLTLLLEAGADPSLAHPKTGLTPAAEACSIGALEEAALLIQLTAAPEGPWSLDQLGWAQALAEAAGNYFWNHATYPDAALEPLLEAWRQQPAPPPAAPPPAACRAVVAALLAHPVLQLAEGATTLQAGAELAGVLQAECLATVGISADLTARLRTSACTSVVLAAAPAATRWSPATHRYFPPAFKQAVRLLLLTNHRLLAQSRSSGAGAGVGSSAGSGAGSGRGGRHVGAATKAVLSRRAMRELLDGTPAAEEAAGPPLMFMPYWASPGDMAESGAASAGRRRSLPMPSLKAGGGCDLGDKPKGAGGEGGRPGSAAAVASAGSGVGASGGSGDSSGTAFSCAELEDACSDACSSAAADGGEDSSRACPASPVGDGAAAAAAGTSSAADGSRLGGAAGGAARGLPRDAVLEVARHLGAAPLSFWLRQPQGQPPLPGRLAAPRAPPPSAA